MLIFFNFRNSCILIIIAKATNRLSSDTDNETDRLLGSQRNDQLKALANNDANVNSGSGNSNNASSDLQPGSSVMKQNASSKEGKRRMRKRVVLVGGAYIIIS